MKRRIGIIDYGMGNLRSVQKGFEKVGYAAEINKNIEDLKRFNCLVLPGVGAFGEAMMRIKEMGADELIIDYSVTGRYILGICLGMQLLFEKSYEYGEHDGLGIIPGDVRRLPDSVKVPHIGWNSVSAKPDVKLFNNIPDGSMFYFVHSYYCNPGQEEWTMGKTQYGLEFTSAVGNNNVWGFQFHPEKSSIMGLRILKNFGDMALGGKP